MKTNNTLSRRPCKKNVLNVVGVSVLFVVLSFCSSQAQEADISVDDIVKSDVHESDGINMEKKMHPAGGNNGKEEAIEYGVDFTFPLHHAWLEDKTNSWNYLTPWKSKIQVIKPMPGRQQFYEDFMNGCIEFYGEEGWRCNYTEAERIAMSLRQPQSMQNYTEDGFKKIRAPEALFKSLQEFWEANKDSQKKEEWPAGNTYTNHWKAPTYMVSVEDRRLRGGGYTLKKQLWDAARDTIQEWTGQELTEVSLYGIRVYKTDAVLAGHVDRLPLVSSAIINVAADVDEPWPLEVISHSGKATNVTMVPGDMVLYESHSVIHGRPFPLKGRYVANVFIHFEPVGHSLRYDAEQEQRKALESDNDGLPSYIIPGSPEEANWRREHAREKMAEQLNGVATLFQDHYLLVFSILIFCVSILCTLWLKRHLLLRLMMTKRDKCDKNQ